MKVEKEINLFAPIVFAAILFIVAGAYCCYCDNKVAYNVKCYLNDKEVYNGKVDRFHQSDDNYSFHELETDAMVHVNAKCVAIEAKDE